MAVVFINKAGGPVTVEIEVTAESPVLWSYNYVFEQNADHAIGSFSGKGQGSGKREHALGLPHELENDLNTWAVALANTGKSKQDYQLHVRWKQDGAVLNQEWKDKGTLTSGQVMGKNDARRGSARLTTLVPPANLVGEKPMTDNPGK